MRSVAPEQAVLTKLRPTKRDPLIDDKHKITTGTGRNTGKPGTAFFTEDKHQHLQPEAYLVDRAGPAFSSGKWHQSENPSYVEGVE
jgi:hypothetical protein